MLLRRTLGGARSAVGVLALCLFVTSCGGAGPDLGGAAPRGSTRCEPGRLEACEHAISTALTEGGDLRELVTSAIAARAARAPQDPWAALLRELRRGGGAAGRRVAILASGSEMLPLPADVRTIRVAQLPPPAAISTEALLLAIGEAESYDHLVYVRPGDTVQVFPRDPLAPFMAGVAPIAHGEAPRERPTRIADDIALAALVRRAFDAAGAFNYLDAAKAADAIAAALAQRDPFSEPVLRARYALQLLGTAGLALEDERYETASEAPPPPAPGDTPYGDLLRVRLAKDSRAAWRQRGPSVLRAVAADRRAALDALLGTPNGCGPRATRPLPPMEDTRDLIFASQLALALAPDATLPSIAAPEARPGPTSTAPAGTLPLKAWTERYKTFVGAVDRTKTAWAYAPSLLHERGGALGMSPAGTAVARRVTELGVAHVAALRTLAEAAPLRYRALAQLPLAYSPGVLTDDRLRAAVVELTQTAVQRRLGAAEGADEILGAALTGVFAGMSYPPAVQPSHFVALQGALTAKLRGDLTARTGWDVAGLYAADALARIVTGGAPDVPFSSAQIARALSPNAALPYPGIAALAASFARYGALTAAGHLDLRATDPERLSPDRREARSALRSAIAGLASDGEEPPPRNVLEEVTTLTDGVIAVLASELLRKAPATKRDTCAAKERRMSDEVRRALERLGDVRRRILFAPRYQEGQGAWVRRTRLLVTLLSDAMDVLATARGSAPALRAGTGPRVRFTVPTPDAEAKIAAALGDWEERELSDALGGAYALGRALLEAPTAERFTQQSGGHLGRVLQGLRAFLQRGSESSGRAPSQPGPETHDPAPLPSEPGLGARRPPRRGLAVASRATLLDTLAAPPAGATGDLSDLFVGYAKASSARGLRDQADLWLLSSLLASGLTDAGPSPEAVALAAHGESRVGWALALLGEIAKAHRGVAPTPAAYADAMKKASDDACQTADTTDVIAVMNAVRAFSVGRRAEARAALDHLLEAASARGIHVPRLTYRYEEKTATRVFALSFDVSYGAGLIEGSTGFQLGLGLRSRGAPEGAMTVTLAPEGSAQANEDAARYYAHTAALAAAYHFLDGDPARGATAARRAIDVVSSILRLGSSAPPDERSIAWGRDARALLALDAELAAEAGQPFLAGDLWTLVRGLLRPEMDDAAMANVLDPLPIGLAALQPAADAAPRSKTSELGPLVARTQRSLAILADALPCTEAPIERGGYEEPSCDAYPLALSLRIADALKKLPHLRRAGSAAQCPVLRSVDAFLTTAEGGTYDPDALTAAVDALRADGRSIDAGIVLTRQRRDGHCGPAILRAARALGRAPSLGSALRADLLSVAVNCAANTLEPGVVDDLAALDRETRLLPDLGRNLKLVLFVTELSLRAQRWDILAELVSQPDFVSRWMTVSPEAATTALLIGAASDALSAGSASAPRDGDAYELLCDTFPPGDRAELCAQVKRLRGPGMGPEQRRQSAREFLEKLVVGARQAAPARP